MANLNLLKKQNQPPDTIYLRYKGLRRSLQKRNGDRVEIIIHKWTGQDNVLKSIKTLPKINIRELKMTKTFGN